ncbi:MAG: T9SS type A sorting domain-containing protein, partial [Mariniphaga sp.]
PPIANATVYLWVLPTGATGSSFTNSITVSFGATAISGNISVTGKNSCGKGTSSNFAVTVNTLPTSAGTITGSATVCQGQSSVVYTVPPIANATVYLWVLPTGATGSSFTNSITVSFGANAVSGNISVAGKNSCGKGPSSTLAITVNPLPQTAGTISGPTTVNQGQNSVFYTVATITNATSYLWDLPTGATGTSATNSITINYGATAISGNISVKGQNSCGYGQASNLAVNVNRLNSSEKNGFLLEKVQANDLPVSSINNNGNSFTVYPNPFTSDITIEVWNSEKTEIDVAIYNLLGQRIKNLFNATNEGKLLLKWDGTNDSGQKVVPGIYLCKVNNETKKVFFQDGK